MENILDASMTRRSLKVSKAQRNTWRLAWLLFHVSFISFRFSFFLTFGGQDNNVFEISSGVDISEIDFSTTACFTKLIESVPYLKHIRRVIYWLESVNVDERFEAQRFRPLKFGSSFADLEEELGEGTGIYAQNIAQFKVSFRIPAPPASPSPFWTPFSHSEKLHRL